MTLAQQLGKAAGRELRRRYRCHHCPRGFVEFGHDEYRRVTGTCINCGREAVQEVMPAEEVERLTGDRGGRK